MNKEEKEEHGLLPYLATFIGVVVGVVVFCILDVLLFSGNKEPNIKPIDGDKFSMRCDSITFTVTPSDCPIECADDDFLPYCTMEIWKDGKQVYKYGLCEPLTNKILEEVIN